VERKRHIGNDIINIVFVDGGPEEMAREWLDTGIRKPAHMIFELEELCILQVVICRKLQALEKNVISQKTKLSRNF
jgi:hypothetical protein